MLHCLNPSGFALKKLSSEKFAERFKKLFTLLDLCVSSLRRGHANLLCIVPILTDDPRRESNLIVTGARAQRDADFVEMRRLEKKQQKSSVGDLSLSLARGKGR